MRNAMRMLAVAIAMGLLGAGGSVAQTPGMPSGADMEAMQAEAQKLGEKMRALYLEHVKGELTKEEYEAKVEEWSRQFEQRMENMMKGMMLGPPDIELLGAAFWQDHTGIAIGFARTETNETVIASVYSPMALFDKDGGITLTVRQSHGKPVDITLWLESHGTALDFLERRDEDYEWEETREYVYHVPKEHVREESRFRVQVDPEGRLQEKHEGINDVTFSLDATMMKSESRKRRGQGG